MAKKKKKKNKPSQKKKQTQKQAVASNQEVALFEEPSKETSPVVEKKVTSEAKPSSAEKKAKSAPANEGQALSTARAHIESGNYRAARAALKAVLESSDNAGQKDQARALLGGLEMDTRTLMVGVLGMITLLLIPAMSFKHALWTLPIPLLLLLLDPSLFRAPENND